MLKITPLEGDDKAIVLKLEGRITGEWVNELRRECEMWFKRGRVVLDLCDVWFVDDNGVETIRAMLGDRVHLTGCSLFVTRLLRGREKNERNTS